jgi:dolichol-phosphate mannosyltransferase
LKVWVNLPTFNEAGNIGRMIDDLVSLPIGASVLVVDDDSPDGTGAIADERAQRHTTVHAMHRRGERGLGTAYLAGFREALARGAEAIVTMDCDYSHDPAQVPELVAALEGAHVVVGSRYVPGGRIVGWSWHRLVLSRSANRFVHALFQLPASDCTSGFRVYRRCVLEEIPWHLVKSTGYSFLVESLLWASRQQGRRIAEVPICFRDRDEGKSKLGWREAIHGAANLLRVWRRRADPGVGRPARRV